MKLPNSNIIRAGIASAWSYGGRLVGLGWTAAMISSLGFSDYGKYSIAVAAAAIINAGMDNAFYVRSFRLDEERYAQERCTRAIFAMVVANVGVVMFFFNYIVGMALLISAGEQLFNTFKSRYLRNARPDLINRFDTMRQVTSIGLAVTYLYLAPHFGNGATLETASAFYLLPYVLILLMCLPFVPGHVPAPPGRLHEIGLLSSEAFAAAVYAQGALLIIGWVAGSHVAGYYSVAQVSALAIAMIGQNYANTFVEKLRASDGHVSDAPGPSQLVRVALLTGAAMASIGVLVLIWGAHTYIGLLCLVLAVFTGLRSVNSVFSVILFLQRRDSLRVRATVTVACIQVALLFPLVYAFGGYGAAVGCVVCESIMFVIYRRAIYGAHDNTTITSPTTAPAVATAQNARPVQNRPGYQPRANGVAPTGPVKPFTSAPITVPREQFTQPRAGDFRR